MLNCRETYTTIVMNYCDWYLYSREICTDYLNYVISKIVQNSLALMRTYVVTEILNTYIFMGKIYIYVDGVKIKDREW